MAYFVHLHITPTRYQEFVALQQQLHQLSTKNIAHAVGDNLADIACQIIEQVFGGLGTQAATQDHYESEQTIQRISANIRKYLPWAMSLLNQERLQCLLDYFATMTVVEDEIITLKFPIEGVLIERFKQQIQDLEQHHATAIPLAFQSLIQIIDQGVLHLVYMPKNMLQFNFMTEKSLSGIIHITTQMGYKRLEKLGQQLDTISAQLYFQYFLTFIQQSGYSYESDSSTHK